MQWNSFSRAISARESLPCVSTTQHTHTYVTIRFKLGSFLVIILISFRFSLSLHGILRLKMTRDASAGFACFCRTCVRRVCFTVTLIFAVFFLFACLLLIHCTGCLYSYTYCSFFPPSPLSFTLFSRNEVDDASVFSPPVLFTYHHHHHLVRQGSLLLARLAHLA